MGKGKKTAPVPAAMEHDERFAHIASDPTFKPGRKKHRVKIDERFKGALDDKKFGLAAAPVDKRGKKVKKQSQRETLAPFYELEEPASKGGALDAAEEAKRRELDARARGEVDGDSSSDDDDDGGSSSSDDDELESVEAEAWDAQLPATHAEVGGDFRAARLAITDQEWKHCRAADLLVVLRSLCPPGGACQKVEVFASAYGAEEMAKEARFGPAGIFDDGAGAGSDDGDDDDDGDEPLDTHEGFDAEKLRNYELRKLRRYFAVATFDSEKTADAVYASGDGVELEATSTPLCLSFVEADQAFDAARLRDAATSGDVGAYEPPKAYCCAARQQTKVECTFDDDDGAARAEAFDQLRADVEHAAGSQYLADSDSDDDADGAALRARLGLGPADGGDVKTSGAAGFDDDFFGAADDEVGAEDVEMTFESFGDGGGDAPAEATPWEKREQRARDRKAERKQRLKGLKAAAPEKAEKKPKKVRLLDDGDDGGDDDATGFDARDFDAQKLVKAEKLAGKTKLRGKRKRDRDALLAEVDQAGFAFDAGDDRFKGLLDGDDRFGVDPSAAEFNKTGAMREVLAEQAKRRKKKREAEEDGRAAKRAGAAKTDDAAAAPALGDLAASLKAKLKKKKKKAKQ